MAIDSRLKIAWLIQDSSCLHGNSKLAIFWVHICIGPCFHLRNIPHEYVWFAMYFAGVSFSIVREWALLAPFLEKIIQLSQIGQTKQLETVCDFSLSDMGLYFECLICSFHCEIPQNLIQDSNHFFVKEPRWGQRCRNLIILNNLFL